MRAGILAAIGLALLAGLLWFAAAEKPAAAPSAAAATAGELVYRSGTYSVRLSDVRCEHEDLEVMVLLDGGLGEAKAAVITMGAIQRAACWAFNGGGSVVSRDYRAADRGQSEDVIPIDWFRRE